LPIGTTLEAGRFGIITSGTSTKTFWTFPATSTEILLSSSIGSGGLSNTGESLYLISPTNTIIDKLSYGNSTRAFNPSVPNVPAGSSIYRTNLATDTNTAADWASTTNPTPGFFQ
jgi:hypothetical protein